MSAQIILFACKTNHPNAMEEELKIRDWWQKNRKTYNTALVIVGILGFISYCIVGTILIPSPYFEISIFGVFFQGIGYLIMMGVANLLYTATMRMDITLNKAGTNNLYHKVIYYGYFTISCLLPFSMTILLICYYHDGYPVEMIQSL